MRRKRVSVLIVILILLISVNQFNTSANPLPASEIDINMNPVPDSDTPLYLKSENITFEINTSVVASGNYTFYNPSNSTVNQTIIFPFFQLYLEDFKEGNYPSKIIEISINGSRLFFGKTEWEDKPAVFFNISVPPEEEITSLIKFETHYTINKYGTGIYTYITTTALQWDHTIDHAYFKFIFNNRTVGGNISGADDFYKDGDNWIATIERTDWVPEDNINIRWKTQYEFYIDTRPKTYLMTPADGVILNIGRPIFTWGSENFYYSGNTSFDIYMSTNKKDVIELNESACIEKGYKQSYYSTCVFKDHKMFWTVVTHIGDYNYTAEGGPWSFIFDCSCSPDFYLSSPVNNEVISSNTTILNWSTTWDDFCMLYDVYISTDKSSVDNHDQNALVSKNQTSSSFLLSDLQDGITYYWTVKMYYGHYTNAKNGTWSFTINFDSDGDGVRDAEDDFPEDPDRTDASVTGAINFNWVLIICAIIIALVVIISYTLYLKKKMSEKKNR